MIRAAHLAIGVLVATLSHVQAQVPEPLPFEIPDGAELYPDPVGFVVMRGPVESIPVNMYSGSGPITVSQSVLFEARNKSGFQDEARSVRIPVGSYSGSDAFSSVSGNIVIEEFFCRGSGEFAFLRDVESHYFHSSPSIGNNDFDGVTFNNERVDGTFRNTFGLQGNRKNSGYTLFGFPIRDASGDLFYLAFKHYWTAGDYYYGEPGEHKHYFRRWLEEIEVAPEPSHELSFTMGPSSVGDAWGVCVADLGGSPTYWRFGDSGITTGTLAGFPAGGNLMGAAENDNGELVVLLEESGQLIAWSSIAGSTTLGSGTLSASRPGWIDETGACHFYAGEYAVADDACPVHVWRSPTGDWQMTNLCDLFPGETMHRAAFDMTRTSDLRIGTHSSSAEKEFIRVLRFQDGAWTPELIAESSPGSSFADLRVGGIAEDDFLVVYREEESVRREAGWKVWLEQGELQPASAQNWIMY